MAGNVGKVMFGDHLPETSDHLAGFSLEQHPQALVTASGLGTVLIMKAQGPFSKVFQDVEDVQHEKAAGKWAQANDQRKRSPQILQTS